jgi:hypothetical protein
MRVLAMVLALLAGFFVLAPTALAHPGHHGDEANAAYHEEAGADHDPRDHSHPIGEDNYHQKASHGSFEIAYEQSLSVIGSMHLTRVTTSWSVAPLDGIDLVPPVPPPLA